MTHPRAIVIIAGRELREARRNRWIVLLAAAFGVLSLALSLLGLSGMGAIGVAGFGRTAASLLNLILLLVPLMGLLMGAMSVAGERERGSLLMLMAQPVTAQEVLLGKFLGAAGALAASVVLGFGASGVVIARVAGPQHVGAYLGLLGLTLLLGWAHVAMGVLISVATRRVTQAIGIGLMAWLAVICLGDLGLMGTAIVLRLTPTQLLWASLVNPGQVFRLAGVQMLQGNLELLGSSGLYASMVLGAWLLPMLSACLIAWILVPTGLATLLFRRRGAL